MHSRSVRIVQQLILPSCLAMALQAAPAMAAEEAVAADPEHYTVEFENDQIRVLRIKYGPGEKSVMHNHPANLAVFLTDGKVNFTLPDGNTGEAELKAGTVEWNGGGDHLPQNIGDQPMELILVELK